MNPSTCEQLLRRDADYVEHQAELLKLCSTVGGRWNLFDDDEEEKDARESYRQDIAFVGELRTAANEILATTTTGDMSAT